MTEVTTDQQANLQLRRRFSRRQRFAVLAVAIALGGCGSATIDDPGSISADAAAVERQPPAGSVNRKGISDRAAAELVRRHLEAVARSDVRAYGRALAPNVRFNIAGSIYEGRAACLAWAARDPIGQGGRYEILSLRPSTRGVTADVTFRAGTLTEEIRYTIRRGLIVDKVARYRT